MGEYTFTTGMIRRFSYCPRWYYISYILGFHAKSPIRIKFPIGDAIHKVLVTRNKAIFKDRVADLIRSETVIEEDVAFDELLARGELLADRALQWLAQFENILWQEQLVEHKLTINENSVVLQGYPDLVAKRNQGNILIDCKIGTDLYTSNDAFAHTLPFMLHKLALGSQGIHVEQAAIASMVFRLRKERNSPRAKTPIIDIVEVPVCIEEHIQKLLLATLTGMLVCQQHNSFPPLGITNGVCVWCPNGKELQGRRLCYYPDEILKEFSQTSLQRASIEKWRDEL